jgi:hypothetical protein
MATAIPPTLTPIKFHIPDHITATLGLSEWVYITVATAFAVSWKPFINSKVRAENMQKMSRSAREVSKPNIKWVFHPTNLKLLILF